MGPIGSNFSFEDTGLGVRLTVFLMEVLDMESHLTLLDHIIVELIPSRQAGKLRTREMGYWMKEEAISSNRETVTYRGGGGDEKSCNSRAGRHSKSN